MRECARAAVWTTLSAHSLTERADDPADAGVCTGGGPDDPERTLPPPVTEIGQGDGPVRGSGRWR
jgi:hypothetical protein